MISFPSYKLILRRLPTTYLNGLLIKLTDYLYPNYLNS